MRPIVSIALLAGTEPTPRLAIRETASAPSTTITATTIESRQNDSRLIGNFVLAAGSRVDFSGSVRIGPRLRGWLRLPAPKTLPSTRCAIRLLSAGGHLFLPAHPRESADSPRALGSLVGDRRPR